MTKPIIRLGPTAAPIFSSSNSLSTVQVCSASNFSNLGLSLVDICAAVTNPEAISSGPLMRNCQTKRNAMSRPQRDRP